MKDLDLTTLGELEEQVDPQTAELFAQARQAETESLEKGIQAWRKIAHQARKFRTPHRSLARLYGEAGRWSPMAEALKRELALVTDASEKRALLRLLAAIYSDYLHLDMMVLRVLDQLHELDPDDLDVLDDLAGQYERQSRWSDLIGVLRKKAERTSEIEEQIDLWRRIAGLFIERLGSTTDAIKSYERLLELDQRDVEALERLEPLYERTRNWKGMTDLWQRQLELSDDQAHQIQLYRKMGHLLAEQVGNVELAIEAYQNALRLDTEDLSTLQALDRLYQSQPRARIRGLRDADREAFVALEHIYRQGEHWQALIDVLEARAEHTDDFDEKVELLAKMARVYSEEFGHLDLATSSMRLALEIDPGNPMVIETGAELFRKTGNWTEADKLLENGARRIKDPQKKVDVMLSRARLLEGKMREPQQAIDLYQEVLQIDPINGEALNELERLYRGAEDWEALLEVLQRLSEAAVNANQALEIRCRMGQLYEEQLDNPAAAAEIYQQALATAPKNVRSLKALEGLYERTGQLERYIELMEQQLADCSSDEERVQVHRQMAAVWEERLEDLDRATECMEQALNIDPSDANHRSLRRLYRQGKRYDDLVHLLSGRIDSTVDSEERCALHVELAQLYEGPLADAERAVDLYREILSVDHQNALALGGLARFFERSEDWEQAVEALMRMTDTLQDPTELADAHYRLGCIHEQHLSDPQGAREHYSKALETGAEHAEVMTRMLEISRQLGEWSTAVSLMVRLDVVTSDPQRRASLLSEAGMLCLQQLDDEARGVTLLSRALELDPDNVLVGELLEPIYSRDELHEQLEPVLELLLREADQQDSRRILDLNYKLGKAAAALGKAKKALRHYTAVLDIDPSHMQTLVEMAALRRKSRR